METLNTCNITITTIIIDTCIFITVLFLLSLPYYYRIIIIMIIIIICIHRLGLGSPPRSRYLAHPPWGPLTTPDNVVVSRDLVINISISVIVIYNKSYSHYCCYRYFINNK